MKGLKCIKLLILSTIFLPLFGICSNTSALKYDITEFPIAFPNSFGTALSSSDYFEIQFDSSSYVPSVKDDYYYPASLNGLGDSCVFVSNSSRSVWSVGSFNNVQARFPYFDDIFTYSSDPSYLDKFKTCMKLASIPDNLSSHLAGSIRAYAPIDKISYFLSLRPYWFPYSSLYVSSCNVEDGLHRCGKLNLSNNFKSVPASAFGHIRSMQIPLGYPNIEFAQYDHLYFEFESDLDSDSDPTANFDISNFGLRLQVIHDRQVFDNSTCSISIYFDRRVSDPDSYPYTLKYTCDYDFDSLPQNYDFRKLSFRLQFYRLDSNISSIFDYPADTFTFYSSFVVTNYDSTLSDRPFVSIQSGGDLASAPGSTLDPSTDSSTDWFSSLTNLFSFNIVNPFQPIFAMFSGNFDVNNERCASIPTIAGMLNSPESVVCPFFPATVRSIGTSVLGLASTMLIFGFFVHWLGSSSGNNFEDSSTHSWGRFNVKKGGKS